jgi:hypothetical protein
MKKTLLTAIILLQVFIGYGQHDCRFNFDQPYYCWYCDQNDTIWVSTDAYPNQVWEIGAPDKTIFNAPLSSPNALVTRLDTSYPPNDTSSVVFYQVIDCQEIYGFFPYALCFGGVYKVNSDTLMDFGMIEFSPDNSETWFDLLNDTIIYDTTNHYSWFWYDFDKPVLSGNSYGWRSFYTGLWGFSEIFNFQDGDTMQYRFTFISDGLDTGKEGLMFDDLFFEELTEGIPGQEIGNNIEIYPNPAGDKVFIKSDSDINGTILIFNLNGQLISETNSEKSLTEVSTEILMSGVYLIKVIGSKGVTVKKFIKQ